jgi:uncharacterized protein (TIGR03435 family)
MLSVGPLMIIRRVFALGLMGFGLAALPQTAAAPAFDVASIRPVAEYSYRYGRYLPGGHFSGLSSVKYLIQLAYSVEDYQIEGAPGWIAGDPAYRVEAKAASVDATRDDLNAMLQTLLADRFQLKLRREMRDFQVYSLVVDKGGPKLRPLKDGEASKCDRDNSAICGIRTTAQLASTLQHAVDRPVIDKTGLDGSYDLLLDFDTYSSMGRTPPENYNKPSLKTALQEQLGLRLEPQKVSLPVLVIENIQRPTEN